MPWRAAIAGTSPVARLGRTPELRLAGVTAIATPCGSGPRGSRLTVRGSVRHEAEGALLLLRVVQPEHGIQPVEQSPELDDVLGLGGLGVESPEKAPQPLNLWIALNFFFSPCALIS